MQGLINPDVVECRKRFRDELQHSSPFPHVVIESFFQKGFCEELIAAFPPFELACNVDEDGGRGGKATIEDIRSLGSAYARADDLFKSKDFAALVSDLTGIPDLLYDAKYFGGGTHENLPGQELDPHVDFNYHPIENWHRRLNLIVYLNPEWEEEWGGTLDLYEDAWNREKKPSVRVLPFANRAVLFETSERSWHGFERIRQPPSRGRISRRSLAIYMYTKERPPEQTAPSHSTVYVDRPMPPQLKSKDHITPWEYQEVKRMLSRRQQHIERLQRRERVLATQNMSLLLELLSSGGPLGKRHFELMDGIVSREDSILKGLYDREKEFARDEASLRAALGEKVRYGLRIFGKARLVPSPSGYDSDTWAGPHLEMDLAASDRGSKLTIHGHLPEIFRSGQHLECTVGDAVHTLDLSPGEFTWELPVSIHPGEQVHVSIEARDVIVPIRDLQGSEDPRELAYHLVAIELM